MLKQREAISQKLKEVVEESKGEGSIMFKVDVMSTLRKDCEQAKGFREGASNYLMGLHKFLQNRLIEQYMRMELSEIEKQKWAKKLINTYISLANIPYSKSLYRQFSQINSDDIGKWIILVGTVIQSTQKKTLDKSKLFECAACQTKFRCQTSYQNSYQFQFPPACTNMVQKQKSNSVINQLFQNLHKRKQKKNQSQNPTLKLSKCNSKKFNPLDEGKICIDYQQLRIQEQFKFISSGKIPQTITVVIEGDISGQINFRPGDDVSITGILTYRYKKLLKDFRLQPQLVLIANSIILQKINYLQNVDPDNKIESDNQSQMSKIYANFPMNLYSEFNLTAKERIIIKQLQFRRQIIDNFAPSIYGRNMVKLGLLLSLLGGVSLENQSSKIRGHSHVLMVGEPGTGKSVLLKEAAKLAERSFFTNGIGTTSAGLSVSYYKDGTDWMIEAGALVLADNGVCCIDQLTLLSKKDEKSLLECMEQQTISSAKASVIGKLNARTTVICACNPITPGQRYDAEVDLEVNTGLSIPLLTRFDLVFILQDEKDIGEDAQKCDYILGKFCANSFIVSNKNKPQEKQRINLKSLIRKCKSFSPVLSNHEIFTKYYTQQRKSDNKVKTARAFQSLCRIAESHAKLMMRQSTIILDYITAISLTENRYFSTIEEYYAFIDQFNLKYKTNFS